MKKNKNQVVNWLQNKLGDYFVSKDDKLGISFYYSCKKDSTDIKISPLKWISVHDLINKDIRLHDYYEIDPNYKSIQLYSITFIYPTADISFIYEDLNVFTIDINKYNIEVVISCNIRLYWLLNYLEKLSSGEHQCL